MSFNTDSGSKSVVSVISAEVVGRLNGASLAVAQVSGIEPSRATSTHVGNLQKSSGFERI